MGFAEKIEPIRDYIHRSVNQSINPSINPSIMTEYSWLPPPSRCVYDAADEILARIAHNEYVLLAQEAEEARVAQEAQEAEEVRVVSVNAAGILVFISKQKAAPPPTASRYASIPAKRMVTRQCTRRAKKASSSSSSSSTNAKALLMPL